MFFANDQIILQKTEDDLQFAMHCFSLTCNDYNFTMSEKNNS